jgi:hypothetical protein
MERCKVKEFIPKNCSMKNRYLRVFIASFFFVLTIGCGKKVSNRQEVEKLPLNKVNSNSWWAVNHITDGFQIVTRFHVESEGDNAW